MTDTTPTEIDGTPAPADRTDGAHPAAQDRSAKHEQRAQWLSMARTMILDVFGPIVLHSQLTKHGWSEVNALMLAGSLPAIGIVLDKIRGKRMSGLSILVLAGIVLSIVLGLVTGSARSILLEGALTSLGFGLFAMVTLFTRRTIVELFSGAAGDEDTEAGRKVAAAFAREDVKRFSRSVTVVFALVFFASAAAQWALAMWAPIDVAFAYNRFGFIPCVIVLVGISALLFKRARARGELEGFGHGGERAAA